jgi:hypothetical protein
MPSIEDLGTNNGHINIYLERDETQLSFEDSQQAPGVYSAQINDELLRFLAPRGTTPSIMCVGRARSLLRVLTVSQLSNYLDSRHC